MPIPLKKLIEDTRDFSHHKVYGTVAPSNLPNVDFDVSLLPPIILDQEDLNFCTGCSASEINTDLEWSDYSLVDYLNFKKQPSDLNSRANLAVKYNLLPDSQSYLNLATTGQNGLVNLQLLACLIQDNGDYFDFLYQFAKIAQVTGNPSTDGATLRNACQSLIQFGSLKKNQSPFTYGAGKPTDKPGTFLEDWRNWPTELDTIAAENKIGSYFNVDGPNNIFDNIRSTLYLNLQDDIHSAVMFGVNWRPEWTNVPGGIIQDNYSVSQGEGHDLKLRGQKIINGVPYIKAQNSWNKSVGDHGCYYFPRNVINIEGSVGFGMYTFKDLDVDTAAWYNKNGINVGDPALFQWAKIFSTFIKNLISKK